MIDIESQVLEEAIYRLQLEIRQWVLIDAIIDNEMSAAVSAGGQRDIVDLGRSIRKAGWEQFPDWPGDYRLLSLWAASDECRTITLSGAQCELVLSALARWAAVADRADDAESGRVAKRNAQSKRRHALS
ncbi:hypothetical protein Acor_15750 [Acrocarpospora corrugata]|uniref:Uncharacterized protein n=1 Tax=Acrocarpospora corrugata TaxID=35763 RepID=A0A5M3VV07_9ACTN|nr:hypothetical protein [Acrocarpospora corrugata]GER99511.1 hypothetical protein Acor_15750 [Acrocarpospora corrugata]